MDLVCKVLRVKYNKDFIFFSRNPNPICNFPEMYVYFYNLLSKNPQHKSKSAKNGHGQNSHRILCAWCRQGKSLGS